MANQLSRLVGYLLVAAVVWLAYRGKQFEPSLKYRTFWPRFWCGSIDTVVLWPVTALVFLATTVSLSPVVIAALISIYQLFFWGYTVMMHARYGQTVGKMITGVRVVDAATEQAITFRQALLRESLPIAAQIVVLYLEIRLAINSPSVALGLLRGEKVSVHNFASTGFAFAIPSLWFLAEVMTMLSNDKRRALHDYIAGTVVIRTQLVGVPAHADMPARVIA